MTNEQCETMLWELDNAIQRATKKADGRPLFGVDVLRELRLQHSLVVMVQDYSTAWAIRGLTQMIDDSPTVNDVRRELRARLVKTPHSNRGVGFVTPLSFSSDEGSDHEC